MEDWELFAKTVLSGYKARRGPAPVSCLLAPVPRCPCHLPLAEFTRLCWTSQLESVPDPLYWYRVRATSHSHVTGAPFSTPVRHDTNRRSAARTARRFRRRPPSAPRSHHGERRADDPPVPEVDSEEPPPPGIRPDIRPRPPPFCVLRNSALRPSPDPQLTAARAPPRCLQVLFAQGMKEATDRWKAELSKKTAAVEEQTGLLRAVGSAVGGVCRDGRLPQHAKNLLVRPAGAPRRLPAPARVCSAPSGHWRGARAARQR